MASSSQELLARLGVLMLSAPTSAELSSLTIFCEEFKRRPDACDTAAFILSSHSSGHSEAARHFAYQILCFTVGECWSGLDESRVSTFKSAALAALSSWALPIDVESSHVKSAAVKFVTDVVKREWPQRWPDLTDSLVAIARLGETQQDLVGLLLCCLAEEASSTDLVTDMPSTRQSEIMQGLEATAEVFLTSFRDLLERHLPLLTSSAPSGAIPPSTARVCTTCLRVFTAYIPWVPPATLTTVGILPVVSVLLQRTPSLLVEVMAIVTALTTRKYAKTDGDFVDQLLEQVPQMCCVVLAKPMPDVYLSVQVVGAVAMGELVDKLLVSVISMLSVHSARALTLSRILLDGLLAVLKFPSVAAAALAVLGTKRVLDAVSEHPSVKSVIEPILPTILLVCSGTYALDGATAFDDDGVTPTARSEFLAEEFDDPTEYRNVAVVVKERCAGLFRVAASLFPGICCEAVRVLVHQAATNQRSCPLPAAPYSQLLLDSQALLFAASTLASALQPFIAATMDAALRSTVCAVLSSSLDELLAAMTPDAPRFLGSQVSTLGSYYILLSLDKDRYKGVAYQLLGAMEFTSKSPSPSNDEADSLVRRCARESLAQLAKHTGSLFVQVAHDCFDLLRRRMNSDSTPLFEKSEVLEILVLLVNSSNDPSQQHRELTGVLQSCFTFWQLETLTANFTDLSTFLRFLYNDVVTPCDPTTVPAHQMITHSLSTFLAVGKRCKLGPSSDSSIVFAESWASLLPALCHLLGCIHGLQHPEVKRSLLSTHPASVFLYAVSSDEAVHILGDQSMQLETDSIPGLERRWFNASAWLFKCRNVACSLISLAIGHGQSGAFRPSLCPMFYSILESRIFGPESVGFFSCRELAPMCKSVLLPVAKSCPIELRLSIIPGLVGPFLQYAVPMLLRLCQRPSLDSALELTAADGAVDDPLFFAVGALLKCGASIPTLDQLKEKVLRNAMRSVMDVVSLLCEFGDGAPSLFEGSIGRFCFLGHPELSNCLSSALVFVSDWNDASSFRRLSQLWLKCFKVLGKVPEFAPLFSNSLFRVALDALLAQKPWTLECQAELILLLTDVYGAYVLCEPPMSTAPRDLLLSLPFVRRELVASFEKRLTSTSVKKQKAVFREFVQDLVLRSQGGGAPVAKKKAGPPAKVQNIPIPLVKLKLQVKGTDVVGTSGLFPDELDDL